MTTQSCFQISSPVSSTDLMWGPLWNLCQSFFLNSQRFRPWFGYHRNYRPYLNAAISPSLARAGAPSKDTCHWAKQLFWAKPWANIHFLLHLHKVTFKLQYQELNGRLRLQEEEDRKDQRVKETDSRPAPTHRLHFPQKTRRWRFLTQKIKHSAAAFGWVAKLLSGKTSSVREI